MSEILTDAKTLRCTDCGGSMIYDTRPYVVRYQGLSETVDLPGFYCNNCEESVHSGDELAAADAALRRLKARANGLLTPADIKRIRTKLRLGLKAASELIGGGKNSFYRYERGEVLPSVAISNLLRILEQHPEALKLIIEASEITGRARMKTKAESAVRIEEEANYSVPV